MVIGKKFAWCHMPKTGGTSITTMFSIVKGKSSIVHVDFDYDTRKHDSFSDKERNLNINLSDKERIRILGIRRLPEWVLSYRNHKKWRIQNDYTSGGTQNQVREICKNHSGSFGSWCFSKRIRTSI